MLILNVWFERSRQNARFFPAKIFLNDRVEMRVFFPPKFFLNDRVEMRDFFPPKFFLNDRVEMRDFFPPKIHFLTFVLRFREM